MIKPLSFSFFLVGILPFGCEAALIRWESCLNSKFASWFDAAPHPNLRCGFLDVPLVYKTGTNLKEYGSVDVVKIAMTLLPAKGMRKGSLVVISGGTGMPGINPWLDKDWPVNKINEAWDVVGYDPRGVGQPTPKINCMMPENNSAADTEQELITRDLLKACIDNTGVVELKHIGTDEAVSDIDRIR